MHRYPKLKSCFIIIAFLAAGLIIMGVPSLFKMHSRFTPFVLVLLFIALNIVTARIYGAGRELKTFWSLKKIAFLPAGIAIGGLIAFAPSLAELATGKISLASLLQHSPYTLLSMVTTFAIVLWEELWFRGIILNVAHKHLSAISISITIGLLFMLVHAFNPAINLLKTGPALFFAGAFLTIIYTDCPLVGK